MDNKNSSVTILLFFILLGIAWLIWKPLVFLILGGFFFKYWYNSRVEIISLGGFYDPKQYEHPEELLRCKICKIYFHKDKLQEHFLQAAVKEQEVINEMPFLSLMLSKNRHKEYFKDALDSIIKSGGQYEIENDDDTKAIIKGNITKLVDKGTGKILKEIKMGQEKH